jgi:glycosyltransferase involved in cell wall biosynthesis
MKDVRDLDILRVDSSVEFHVIPERIFYDAERMFHIIAASHVDILQFEDAVSVLRYQDIFLKLNLPVCLELHDIDMALRESLGRGKEEIDKALIVARRAVQLSDAIICMTPYDYRELGRDIRVPRHRQYLIPNPVDLSHFPAFGPNVDSLVVLFIGNMFYWPNLHAAEYIIQNFVGRVAKRHKHIKFFFVGAISKRNMNRLKRQHVFFAGYVKDLDFYLKSSTLALCPVTEGSGMKVKILNYCAAAIPVITTTMGVSGYERIKSLIVEDNLDRYPEIICDLLDNKTILQKIGAKNRSYIKKYYDISKIASEIKKIYTSLARCGPRLKRRYKERDVPLPFWLDEERIRKIKNDTYYVIQHGELLSKKSFAPHFDR